MNIWYWNPIQTNGEKEFIMMNETTTMNTSAVVTTSNPIFNVVTETTLTKYEEIKFKYEINFLRELKKFVYNSGVIDLNSNVCCVKVSREIASNVGKLFRALSIDKEHEWYDKDENYLYLLLTKDNFRKIESSYYERLSNMKIPVFETEDGNTIFGYTIKDSLNKEIYHLFGSKMSKTLSLFFTDNKYNRFVIEPLYRVSETDKEEFIEVYDEVDTYNEKIVRETILQSTEESFAKDEDAWI